MGAPSAEPKLTALLGGALCAAWSEIVARNACSRLSAHCAFFAQKLGFDEPITLADVESTVSEILALAQHNEPATEPVVELRDYQLEAIELCVKATESATMDAGRKARLDALPLWAWMVRRTIPP